MRNIWQSLLIKNISFQSGVWSQVRPQLTILRHYLACLSLCWINIGCIYILLSYSLYSLYFIILIIILGLFEFVLNQHWLHLYFIIILIILYHIYHYTWLVWVCVDSTLVTFKENILDHLGGRLLWWWALTNISIITTPRY